MHSNRCIFLSMCVCQVFKSEYQFEAAGDSTCRPLELDAQAESSGTTSSSNALLRLGHG